MKFITKTVWLLSIISLLTDTASEMLYPIMPIYLQSIGFSIVLIGVLEGFVEMIAGLSKGYFGKLSDSQCRRSPFIQLGYGMSAISKPMLALFAQPVWIFFSRTVDRLGKGIRTGARDAMLSDEATPQTKGRVFGFHRSMDTTGAFLGPTLALIFLYFFPAQYKTLFLIAFIPGIFTIFLSMLLKDKIKPNTACHRIHFLSFLRYWKESPKDYRTAITGFLIFAMFNSSDVFLLLKLRENGLSDSWVIGAYIFYNLIYALAAYPFGVLADKISLRTVFLSGLGIFAAVYAGMAFNTSIAGFFVLFFLYGIYAAMTEGVSKAWISNITDKKDTATAIGTYSAFQSIAAMIASSLAGFLWFKFSPAATFLTTAVVTAGVIVYFLVNSRTQNHPQQNN